MNPRHPKWLVSAYMIGLLFLLTAVPGTAFAQFYDESYSEDSSFQEEDAFFESYGDDMDSLPGSIDSGISTSSDFSEGNTYEEESPIPPIGSDAAAPTTAGGRQRQLTIQGDKQHLPLNVAWGAGTGLLIGGWFALVNEGDNRATQRSIGLGIVLGTILGAGVGMRSLLIPSIPRAVQNNTAPRPEPLIPVLAIRDNRPMVGFRLLF